MADEDQDPLEDDQDPTAGTQADDPEDTADASDQPDGQIDWEARYKQAEKKISAQGAEISILRRGEQPEPDEGTSDEPASSAQTSGSDDIPDEFVQDSWALAQQMYGEDAIAAFEAADRIASKARTPADVIAAYEAYHEIRSAGGTRTEAAAAASDKPSRREAVQPKVDANRSDRGPDLDEKELSEARKSGSLDQFVGVASRALGFGSRTPTKPKG